MGYMKEEVKRINQPATPQSGARPNAGKDSEDSTGLPPDWQSAES